MYVLLITQLLRLVGGWDPVNRVDHTSWVAVVTPIDRPGSVRNRCVIEVFGGVCVLSCCFWGFSVVELAFIIGLSQISSIFSCLKGHQCFTNNSMSTLLTRNI